ncbi:MAG: aspartyl protease family protein [Planctomycetes bacterium]|nr:aspartyl protease family protein [Planctomycetota bacterium]
MLVALAACLAGCQATRLPTSMPLSPRFLCQAEVADAPARFVLDSGCPGTLLDAGTAARLGLREVPTSELPVLTDVTGRQRRPEGLAQVWGLELGEVSCAPFPAPLLPPGALPGLDGILGMNVLGAFAWIFDMPAAQAVLLSPGTLESELAARGFRVEGRVPLVRRDHGVFVSVQLDGREVEVKLDTGAAATTLTRRLVTELGLQPVDPAGADGGESYAVGIHGELRAQQRFRLARMQLGPRELRDVVVTCHVGGDPPQGNLLGADVLGQIRWAVDWSRGELVLWSR